MPTPDASQFTQLQKYNAISARQPDGKSQQKTYTSLYQPVPSVPNPTNFLASPGNKNTSVRSFIPINRKTGIEYKPKVPAGFGNPAANFPSTPSTPSPPALPVRRLAADLSDPLFITQSPTTELYDLHSAITYFTAGNAVSDNLVFLTTANINPLSYLVFRFTASAFTNNAYRFRTNGLAAFFYFWVGKTNTSLTLEDVVSAINETSGLATGPLSPNFANTQTVTGQGSVPPDDSFLLRDFTNSTDFVDVLLINWQYVNPLYFELLVDYNPIPSITWNWPVVDFGASPIVPPVSPATGGPFNIMVVNFSGWTLGRTYTISTQNNGFEFGFTSVTSTDAVLIARYDTVNSIIITIKPSGTYAANQSVTFVFADRTKFDRINDIISIV